jgi:tetratricopeptide (TPR) repeat protein
MSVNPNCRFTHKHMVSGMCPLCGTHVAHGLEGTLDHLTGRGEIEWNADSMITALSSPDTDERLSGVSNLMFYSSVEFALPILRCALNVVDNRINDLVEHSLLRFGDELTAEKLEMFERHVTDNPNDFAIHLLLLGGYFIKRSYSEQYRLRRQAHVLWVIWNKPESDTAGSPHCELSWRDDGEAFSDGMAIWNQNIALYPHDARVLGNAAAQFIFADRAKSMELYRRAESLEPTNPNWPQHLGHLYYLEAMRSSDDRRKQAAQQAVAAFEKTRTLSKNLNHYLLVGLAKACVIAEDYDRARMVAGELISVSQPTTSRHLVNMSRHYGYLTLGYLAFQSGDIDEAERKLFEAGNYENSSVSGPNMYLAYHLLQRGERDAVVEFLRRASKWWESTDHTAERWIYMIEHGETPDFQTNLFS